MQTAAHNQELTGLLKEAIAWVAFVERTSTNDTNRQNAKELIRRIEAAVAKA